MNFKEFDDLLHRGAEKIVLYSDVIFSSEDEPEYIRGYKLDVNGQGKALIIDGDRFKLNVAYKGTAIYNRQGEIQHGN